MNEQFPQMQVQPSFTGTPANWNRPTTSIQQPQVTTLPYIPQPTVMIPGKVVNSHEEIGPQDVPMNGQVSFFPKADYSEIYAKCWTNDGRIDTRVYIMKPVDEPAQVSTIATDEVLSEILSRLQTIEKKLNYKPHHNKPRYDKSKEVNNG